MANTTCKIEIILEGIKKGSPQIETLDISRNKLKINEANAIVKYVESAHSLTDLNLNSTKFPVECLKDLLLGNLFF